jgi:hypothetical protein
MPRRAPWPEGPCPLSARNTTQGVKRTYHEHVLPKSRTRCYLLPMNTIEIGALGTAPGEGTRRGERGPQDSSQALEKARSGKGNERKRKQIGRVQSASDRLFARNARSFKFRKGRVWGARRNSGRWQLPSWSPTESGRDKCWPTPIPRQARAKLFGTTVMRASQGEVREAERGALWRRICHAFTGRPGAADDSRCQ